MTLTGVTLLVTSLLVASPILFLISAAPSMPQREGCVAHDDCLVSLPPPECQETICKNVATGIQAKINWKVDVCKDFKSFSCSEKHSSLRIMRSPQEIVDHQMLRKSSSFFPSLHPICHPQLSVSWHRDCFFLASCLSSQRALAPPTTLNRNMPKPTDEAVPVPSFVSSSYSHTHNSAYCLLRHENINFIHSALHCSQFFFILLCWLNERAAFLEKFLSASPSYFPFNWFIVSAFYFLFTLSRVRLIPSLRKRKPEAFQVAEHSTNESSSDVDSLCSSRAVD